METTGPRKGKLKAESGKLKSMDKDRDRCKSEIREPVAKLGNSRKEAKDAKSQKKKVSSAPFCFLAAIKKVFRRDAVTFRGFI
jgi:hypothetical protein